MKYAFVHDWIVHEGGGEAVLRQLITRNSPTTACIFTLYSTKNTFAVGSENIPIITAMPQRCNRRFVWCNTAKPFFFRTLFDYRNLMFRFPVLCRLLQKKIRAYHADEIIISSFAAVKNIISPIPRGPAAKGPVPIGAKTTLYLHSPMQYIRENYDENIKKLRFPIKQLYARATLYLRPRDIRTRHYDTIFANSRYTATLAKNLYAIDATILYPAVHPLFFSASTQTSPKNYFVFVGRVQRYVREIDTIIALINASGENLLVIGDGPDMAYAQSIAGPTITFLGQIQDVTEKIRIMRDARGCINLAKESFGLGTAESLCLGVPVFGYAGGATPELVKDGIDGILVRDKTATTLAAGRKSFVATSRDRTLIAQSAHTTFTSPMT